MPKLQSRTAIIGKLLQIEDDQRLHGWHHPPALYLIGSVSGLLASRRIGKASREHPRGIHLPDLDRYRELRFANLNLAGRPVAIAAAFRICRGCVDPIGPAGTFVTSPRSTSTRRPT